jgi:hypothetical protein
MSLFSKKGFDKMTEKTKNNKKTKNTSKKI